jgi:hypothetical protein
LALDKSNEECKKGKEQVPHGSTWWDSLRNAQDAKLKVGENELNFVFQDTNYVCPIPPCKVWPVVIVYITYIVWLKKNSVCSLWLIVVG